MRSWKIHITQMTSEQHFLGYAERYFRRPPISQPRTLKVAGTEVAAKTYSTPSEFMARSMSRQIPAFPTEVEGLVLSVIFYLTTANTRIRTCRRRQFHCAGTRRITKKFPGRVQVIQRYRPSI